MSPAALEFPTRFSNLADFARLPWFTVSPEGRLRVRPGACGPIVDVHTHLALSYLAPRAVDLGRASKWTRHYLPADGPMDLELYSNKNIQPADLVRMKLDLALGAVTSWGMRATHTVPNLLAEMEETRVDTSVLLAIDFPRVSRNTEAWIEAARGHRGLLVFGSVHPWEPKPAARLDEIVAMGARGVKIHPNVQLIPPDDERVVHVCELAGRRNLPILFHCGPVGIEGEGGAQRTQVRRYETAIRECPNTTFVLGHSGALQPEVALELHRRYDNVWLEISSQGLGNVRRIVAEADLSRVLFGSDWPFYHPALPLAKLLIATEGEPSRRDAILYDNAARLLGLPPADRDRA